MSIRELDHIRPRRGKPALWTQSASARSHFGAETLGEMALASANFGLDTDAISSRTATLVGMSSGAAGLSGMALRSRVLERIVALVVRNEQLPVHIVRRLVLGLGAP